jgi:phospholipid/cholesterol/gamma-HCH transport system ATP-binding protein
LVSADIAISVRGLVTRFGAQTVHDGLDLDVRRGEILGVVGPSGCGKSVLLREIVGLQELTAGEIGFPYFESKSRVPRLGVMFQDGALFSNLTVLENVEAPLREHTRLTPRLRAEIASLKLAMAGLGPDAHHKKPAQISGGMRKRAAVARALALDPELLFLDEPTAGLDPIAAENFDAMTRDLAKSLGLTVFLVTHASPCFMAARSQRWEPSRRSQRTPAVGWTSIFQDHAGALQDAAQPEDRPWRRRPIMC